MSIDKNKYKNVNGNYDASFELVDDLIGSVNFLEESLIDNVDTYEYGNNENGEYWKYKSGRLVCKGYATINQLADGTAGASLAWPSWFYQAVNSVNGKTTSTWTYPHEFIEPPSIAGSGGSINSIIMADSNIKTGCAGLGRYKGANRGFFADRITLIADGKWK